MNIQNKFNVEQKQRLNLTPYIKQSIEILKFSEKDLEDFISKEILSNPLLKRKKPKNRISEKNYDVYEKVYENENTLEEYLASQISLLKINKYEKKILEFLIGNINKNGYLDITLEVIIDQFSINKLIAKKMISLLQSLEPSGIGAFNLQECLLIQLEKKKSSNSLAYKIIKYNLEDLANNKIIEIAKSFNVSIEEIKNVKKQILKLNPTPASDFNFITKGNYITPDVIIKKINEENKVFLNTAFTNTLEINPYFLEIDKTTCSEEEINFIQEKLESANNIIKSIEKRNNTLLLISQEILKLQADFFKFGKLHIKKMSQKIIADNLKINISTVSRAISEKYLECPFGVFEMKYFFQNGITSKDNSSHSSEKIKIIIKDIIKKENKKKPLSDKKITDILNLKGIAISRRCVTKYRLELNIQPTAKRKEY
ncbi:MAG: RNA polymerase factor sigma-54 [Fusobacteriaceae bacterium]|nr:RNA polymerase factor sigma-54 [Fusobacteriaceae bacterium]MBN2837480.1 RNA polymerase factor sigma-54 [Fusobacteriaceae bacterium]